MITKKSYKVYSVYSDRYTVTIGEHTSTNQDTLEKREGKRSLVQALGKIQRQCNKNKGSKSRLMSHLGSQGKSSQGPEKNKASTPVGE